MTVTFPVLSVSIYIDSLLHMGLMYILRTPLWIRAFPICLIALGDKMLTPTPADSLMDRSILQIDRFPVSRFTLDLWHFIVQGCPHGGSHTGHGGSIS